MPELDLNFFIALLGVFFLGAGLAGILGPYKRWYWNSKRMIFAYVPVGILFILSMFEKTITDPTLHTVVRVFEFMLLGVAVWWSIRPPKLIVPAWIQMIESHPKEVYTALAEAVKNGEDWKQKVNDPQTLDAWIQDVKKRMQKSKKSK